MASGRVVVGFRRRYCWKPGLGFPVVVVTRNTKKLVPRTYCTPIARTRVAWCGAVPGCDVGHCKFVGS